MHAEAEGEGVEDRERRLEVHRVRVVLELSVEQHDAVALGAAALEQLEVARARLREWRGGAGSDAGAADGCVRAGGGPDFKRNSEQKP